MKKKVLLILHLPPPIHGSSVVGQFIKESKLINSSIQSNYINFGTSRELSDIGKNSLKKVVRYILLLVRILIKLIVFRPEICYLAITSKGSGFYKDALVVFFVKMFNVKIVFHLHNKGIVDYQNRIFDNFLYKRVFNNSKVILLSNRLYQDISKYVNINDVFICPNGIPDVFNGVKREVKTQKDEIVNLLFMSNLFVSKGVITLLKALQLLRKCNYNFSCTFIGDEGDISKELFTKTVFEMKLEKHVRYVGKKNGKDKQSYFQNSDIFILPSLNETFGLVNLEAMQFKLPVISTKEGGIPDVIEDGFTGYLFNKNNEVELFEKIELLINNRNLRTFMGENGRRKYENEFTLEIFEKKFHDIFYQM